MKKSRLVLLLVAILAIVLTATIALAVVKVGPTAVAGSNVKVFPDTPGAGGLNISRDRTFCFYFKNVGGGGGSAITDLDILVAPDNVNWSSLTFPQCDTLTSGQMCNYCMDGSKYAYIKVEVNATDTTFLVWYEN